MLTFLMTAMTLASVTVLAENFEPLEPSEEARIRLLENITWQKTISEEDLSVIIGSLHSAKDIIAEKALCAAISHNMTVDPGKSHYDVGPANGYSRLLYTIVTNGIGRGVGPLESLQIQNIRKIVPPFAVDVAEAKAGHIVAIQMAKRMRNGEVLEPDASKYAFSSLDLKLLQYSRLEKSNVVHEIISKLTTAKVAGKEEYELLEVLASFGHLDPMALLSAFEDEGTSKWGKLLIASGMELLSSSWTLAERRKVVGFLGRVQTSDVNLTREIQRTLRKLGAEPQATFSK